MSSREKAHDLRPVLIAFSFAAMLFALAMFMVPATTQAATHTKDVRGYVYDAQYRTIEGADVTVTMFISESNPRTVHSELSNAAGYYNLQFQDAEWEIGDTIQVIATFSGQQSDPNETAATNAFYQWLNATAFEFEIPQFGSTVGLLLTVGIIGVVAVTVMFWRRR